MKIAIICIVIVLAIIILYAVSCYNSFVKLSNTVKEAFSTMDIYFKKRWDLIPNLVETVKGYAKHESKTLENVVKIRASSYSSLSDKEKIAADRQLTENINKIMAVAESHPELKASQNFLDLSSQLTQVENDIANARKYYNGAARKFNDKVQMVPSNVIAGIFGFEHVNMIQIDETERTSVKVSFNENDEIKTS